jgi:Domain of unknown function (DUF4280)
MPGYLLHQGATVLCAHGGQAQPTAVNPRVKINGQSIVTQSNSYTISGCSLPPPPNANGPCVSAQWTRGAVRVKAGGVPVLLQDSQASCAPTGTGLTIVTTQTTVRGT